MQSSLGDLLIERGDLAEGARAYEQAFDAAQSYGGPDVLAQTHCCLARIALYRSRAMPYPYAEAKALYVYGQLYAARGEAEQAQEKYQTALAILHQLGERLYAARIERALAKSTYASSGE